MTEDQMREADVPWPKTEAELTDYIRTLVERPHDYGTCVYAMSMAAVAAYQYVAGKLGTTGFQASCADLDILRRTRCLKHGFAIIDFDKLLFPQYEESVPGYWEYIEQHKESLAKEARKRIAEAKEGSVHVDVLKHWYRIAEMSPEPATK